MKAKILVVEDSSTERLIIKNILEEHDIITANDGVEAMEILRNDPSIDIMILDLNMPRMNGFQVLEALNENPLKNNIRVVILTNYDEPENEIKGIELGAVDYITKPFAASIVLTRINSQLKLKRQRDMLEKQKLELAAINEDLESFSYSVSHDLKTPLNIIKIYSDFLRKSIMESKNTQQLEDINTIIDATNRMYQLIEDILQLSKVGRSEIDFQNVKLSEMAESIMQRLRLCQPERQIEFICNPNITTMADLHFMEILMFNLLQNAWKYTSRKEKAVIEFGTLNKNNEEVYFIRDNGIGFDMSQATELFTKIVRFNSSADYEGTGIGLTIVNRIIKKHSGSIWAESEVGKGSTFYFTLRQ